MDSTNENKEAPAEAPAGAQPPPTKKPRSTVDLRNPTITNFKEIWMDGPFTEDSLTTAEGLFGNDRLWFVRESYISLYDAIMEDEHYMQIVNGSAGIGKSAFLLYMLARLQSAGKSVLLHVHRDIAEHPQAIYFPSDGSEPTRIERSGNASAKTFDAWYRAISEDNSVVLIDGIVSFTLEDYPNIKYVAAKSPSCSIGWMDKAQMRRDRWLKVWHESELLSYAKQVNIQNATELIHNNFLYLGGVSRYAFIPNAAENAAQNAVSQVGAKKLFKLVDKGLLAKFDNQQVVDRLIHRHPPPTEVGVMGTTFTFASEFVSTKVAMALALENEIDTATLLAKFKGVGPAGGMRGVLFEAYAARKLAEGGKFSVREVATGKTSVLELDKTSILQKDTKALNKTQFPPAEIQGKFVWPKPDYNLPTIDAFMLYKLALIALQMTVSTSHSVNIDGAKAFLRYFDSVMRELCRAIPASYPMFFAVPADVFDNFSQSVQSMTGTNGKVLETQEAKKIAARISQYVLKVE